jgi:biopolymer transport protein ExbD
MSKLGRNRKRINEDIELDMVPLMNMFLVLIPLLLLSASFFHLKAINTSVPVLSETEDDVSLKESEIRLTVIVEIEGKGIHLSAISDTAGADVLTGLDRSITKVEADEYPLDQLMVCLENIKSRYPASDTVIIIPDGSVVYDTIVQTMDVARYSNESPLFPRVVLSGKVG